MHLCPCPTHAVAAMSLYTCAVLAYGFLRVWVKR